MNRTTTDVANFFVNHLEKETAEFINSKANKIFCAKYIYYGKIFSKFIKDNYLTKIDLTGASNQVAFEIVRGMEAKGYDYILNGSATTFEKN